MALTSPNMGLRIWTNVLDRYDHDQQAANLAKIDYHDHTPGRGLQLPTESFLDGSVTTIKLADGAVTTPKLSAALTTTPTDGSVTTAKLADNSVSNLKLGPDAKVDPLFNAKHTLFERAIILNGGSGAGLWGLSIASAATNANWGDSFTLDPANFPVGSRTLQVRIIGNIATNATAPASNFTLGLAAVVPSGTGVPSMLPGSALVSTNTIVAPVGTSLSNFTSAWIAHPGPNYYGLTLTTSAPLAAAANVAVRAQLQMQIV